MLWLMYSPVYLTPCFGFRQAAVNDDKVFTFVSNSGNNQPLGACWDKLAYTSFTLHAFAHVQGAKTRPVWQHLLVGCRVLDLEEGGSGAVCSVKPVGFTRSATLTARRKMRSVLPDALLMLLSKAGRSKVQGEMNVCDFATCSSIA